MDTTPANNQNPTSEHHTTPPPSFISQRTLVLILALGGITLFFLFLALRPQWKTQQAPIAVVSPSPTPTPYAQSVLSLVPEPIANSAPGTLTYDVIVNSNINTVNAVQLELAFDPKILSNISITPGTFFAKPVVLIKNIDYKLGRISYAIGIQPADYGKKGQGTIAAITFSYLPTATSTTITFLPKTLVAAEGVTQSVLRDAQPVNISLGSPQGTKTQ